MQVLFGRGGGGFIFLSANGKAQGALLLFLLSLGGGGIDGVHYAPGSH